MMTRQARPSAKINGFDTHMILEAVPAQPSERPNGHQVINQTSRHYAEALSSTQSEPFGYDAPKRIKNVHFKPLTTIGASLYG
jgi:hypothetical protein